MMSENVMVTPLFHQRSHSMPVGHAFINSDGSNNNTTTGNNNRAFDFKRPSPLKNDLSNEGFPLPVPKSLASQLHTNTAPTPLPTISNTKQVVENNQENSVEPKFFCNPKTILNLFDYNNNNRQSCPIIFNCKMDRGFFISQSHWTCYRRNYFQVTASFIIPGHSDGTCYALQLNSDKPMQPIQQFFLRLKACTSTSSTINNEENTTILENHNMIRPVALTQMTPKRDKGPQREPPTTPITPSDTLYGCEQVCVTFERLQFRVATANNGKRRASQQYFRLIFELVAQLDDQSYQVISECYSSPLVVRGRSPGHYSSEQQQHSINTVNSTSSSRKKRKTTTSPITPSPMIHVNEEKEEDKDSITLPPPQYVFASPPMVLQHHHQRAATSDNHHQLPSTSSVTSSSSSFHVIPNTATASYNNQPHSAFSNFHNRSQSANDSEFFARHRQSIKYNMMDNTSGENNSNGNMFDTYEVGMARALRNWQQQVVQQQQQHQRTDSYESFDNNRASTRPGTPIPYHHSHHNSSELYQQQNGWSTTTTTTTSRHSYVDNSNDKLNNNNLHHDGNELYNNNNNNN